MVTITTGQPPFARRLLDALPFTIWSVDLEGRITATNNAWSRFAEDNGAPGIAPESAVIGCSVFSSVADDASREQIERAMLLLRERLTPIVRWEFPCSSPDEERVFLMQVTALEENDEVTGFVFATVDITPSHRSREALINTGIALAEAIALDRVYEEVALQLKRAIPSTGFVIALADDESGKFIIAHRQGYAAYSPEEIELRLTRDWLDALATGNVVHESTPNGLEITAPLVSAEGVLGALTLYAEPLESESETHELRNPLFGISSAAQLLRFRAREDPVVEKNVGRILREVERLNKMVTSLLEFGRPNAVHLQPADPETVWDDILEGERARLDTHRITVRRSRPNQPVRCLLDAEQLGQVFRNILVNACDAAPEGSELQLVSQLSPLGGWRCRLTNGGPAIPPEVLPHVFEFFYSTKAGGTGIGLALCQRIMDEHHGTISIDSQPEQGTTLTLTLPATAAT